MILHHHRLGVILSFLSSISESKLIFLGILRIIATYVVIITVIVIIINIIIKFASILKCTARSIHGIYGLGMHTTIIAIKIIVAIIHSFLNLYIKKILIFLFFFIISNKKKEVK